jgi:hypothetical protein
MAFEVDQVEPSSVNGVIDGQAKTRDPLKPVFQPMRRKLHVVVGA